MPAGVSLSVYLRHMTASLLSMFAGAQLVHSFYKPLADLDDLVEAEKERLEAEAVKVQDSQDS